jgi:hypothetical protein
MGVFPFASRKDTFSKPQIPMKPVMSTCYQRLELGDASVAQTQASSPAKRKDDSEQEDGDLKVESTPEFEDLDKDEEHVTAIAPSKISSSGCSRRREEVLVSEI